jgi:hypothetical protein
MASLRTKRHLAEGLYSQGAKLVPENLAGKLSLLDKILNEIPVSKFVQCQGPKKRSGNSPVCLLVILPFLNL